MADESTPKRLPPPLPPGFARRPLPTPRVPGTPTGIQVPPVPPSPFRGELAPPRSPQNPFEKDLSSGSATSQGTTERLKKMEEQTRDLEDSKKKLERALAEMDLKLKEEKEKALAQTIKAREEESLSLKMEHALKEMQDKARRDRREQELEEGRLRADEKSKELERRLNEEREAWVINLKKQMEMRDSETHQVESQIETRFRDLERRWMEEKSNLTQALKSKEEELSKAREVVGEVHTQTRRTQEDTVHTIELAKKKFEQDLQAKSDAFEREKRTLSEKVDLRERELVSFKAQLAMIDSQIRAAQETSVRSLQEKERVWQSQLSDLQKDVVQLRQLKDQLQTDLTRSTAELIALRKEIGEGEKKYNSSEQRVQELKFSLSQAEIKGQETALRFQSELSKKVQEYEHLEKNYFDDRKRLTEKLEDQIHSQKFAEDSLVQKERELTALKNEFSQLDSRLRGDFEKEKSSLLQHYQDLFSKKDQEVASLKGELVALEQKLHAQFEKERSVWTKDHHETISKRDSEIAALKLENTSIQSRLEEKHEKEKRELLERAAAQFREEVALKAELMHRELVHIRESIMLDLVELDKQVEEEKSSHHATLKEKEDALSDTLNAMKELQRELLNERSRGAEEIKALKDKFDLEHSQMKLNHSRAMESLEVEKDQAREQLTRELAVLKKELADNYRSAENLRQQIDNEKIALQNEMIGLQTAIPAPEQDIPDVNSASGNESFLQKIWKYLSRTVIVVNLRPLPRKKAQTAGTEGPK